MNEERNKTVKKVVRIALWTCFSVYLFIVLKILFLDARYRFPVEQIRYHVNFIPFHTVTDYVKALVNDRIELDTVLKNLVGNLLLLFPLGCMLPCLFLRMRRLGRFSLTVLLLILSVELLQIGLRVGSFDVDDIMFNFVGAVVGYAAVHIPPFCRLLRKCHFYT